jgi:hypothetical protein
MARNIALTNAEFAALAAVDGTRKQPKLPSEINTRLRALHLIERRAWPYGPLWRTNIGNRCVKVGR